MPHLPARFAAVILAFAPLFVDRRRQHARAMPIGAILAPGRRTVASAPRSSGHARNGRCVDFHRVPSRAVCGTRAGGHILLGPPIEVLAPHGPVAKALADTIERRWGRRLEARGIHRDPMRASDLRASDLRLVKARGRRRMSLALLTPIAWARPVWALPFLTAPVPSERSRHERRRRHKPPLDAGRHLALQARRRLPDRDPVPVGDSGFSALPFLDTRRLPFLDTRRRGGVTAITRLRRDAALHEPAPPRSPGTIGRPRRKGARLPTLPEALEDAITPRQAITAPGRCGAGERVIEIAAATAAWRQGGLPVVPIRRLLLRGPQEPLRAPGAARHRSDARAYPDRGLARAAPERAGHVPGGPCASGRGDAAAVVRPADRPHRALPARPVPARHPARRPAPGS